MFVVINVDDLGLHPAVRRAVEQLAGEGRVTSSTLLANGPDLEQAAGLKDRLPDLGLGAHLNILRGRPVSDARDVSTLVGPDGLFPGNYVELFKAYLLRRLDLDQVRREWSAQIEKLLGLGIPLTHLDGEKHVHAWPRLMALACELARRYHLGWVRRPREPQPLSRWDKGSLRARVLNTFALAHPRRNGVRWPDRVWGVADQGGDLLPGRFEKAMAGVRKERGGPETVVEIVVHPGDPRPGDPPLPPEFGPMRVDAQWRTEFTALQNPAWAQAFARLGARPTHYGRLGPSAHGA